MCMLGRLAVLLCLGLVSLEAAVAPRPGSGAQESSKTTPDVERTEYDMTRLARPPALSDSELAGRRVFVQRCAICHDPVGQPRGRTPGPWLDRETIQTSGEARVREMIGTGSRRMPGFQHALRPERIDQIVQYMQTVTPDQRPD